MSQSLRGTIDLGREKFSKLRLNKWKAKEKTGCYFIDSTEEPK